MTNGVRLDAKDRKLRLGNDKFASISELRDVSCLVLVGAGGTGKSTLIRAEFDAIRADGGIGRILRLDQLASDQELLEAALPMLGERDLISAENRWHLFFDGFDESGELPPALMRRISVCIRRMAEQGVTPPLVSLRIATRRAETATQMAESIGPIFPHGSTSIALLQVLTDEQISEFVRDIVNDPSQFLRSIENDAVKPLAQRPLTLRLLANLYAQNDRLPKSRRALYRAATSSLLQNGGLDPEPAMLVAAKLAATMVISNRLTIWTGDPAQASTSSLSMAQLDASNRAQFEAILAALIKGGLLEETAPFELRWFHHSLAEYLTALHLDVSGIPSADALRLLQTEILNDLVIRAQLRDTAAWLAASRDDFLHVLIRTEADVLLDSDVLLSENAAREAVVDALLNGSLVRGIQSSGDMGERYARLVHPGLATQLRSYLLSNSDNVDAKAIAIEIAQNCWVSALTPELVGIALDASQPVHARSLAVITVDDLGVDDDRVKLLPLTETSQDSDPDEEVRGCALSATWPQVLQPADLFGRLTLPRNPSLVGSYSLFLHTLELPALDRQGALAALSWLADSPAEYFQSSLGRVAQLALVRVWEASDDTDVLHGLAELIAKQVDDWSHALRSLDSGHLEELIALATCERRRKLFYKVLDCLPAATPPRSRPIIYLPIHIFTQSDLPWLVADVSNADLRTPYADPLVQCIVSLVAGSKDIRDVGFVWDAGEHVPELAAALAEISSISLDSEIANVMRQQLIRQKQRSEDAPPRVETAVDQFNSLVESYAKGDRNAWWLANIVLLTDEKGNSREDLSRLDTGAVWVALSAAQRESALELAQDYLTNLHLTPGWLQPNQHHRPAMAAYRALRLLHEHNPPVASRFISGDAHDWILPTLTYRGSDGREERRIRSELLRQTYLSHPGEFLSAVDRAISSLGESTTDDIAEVVSDWADGDLINRLWRSWSETYPDGAFKGTRTALRLFARREYDPLQRLFTERLREATETEEADESFLGIADAIFDEQPGKAKEWLLPLIDNHQEIAISVLKQVTGYWSNTTLTFLRSLDNDECVRLYSFAKVNIPAPPEQHGAYTVTSLHNVEQLRQRLLSVLVDRGTQQSVNSLLTLRDTHKDQPWLQRYVNEAIKVAKTQSTDWPVPSEVLRILAISHSNVALENAVPAPLAVVSALSIESENQDVVNLLVAEEPASLNAVRSTFLLFATEWNSGHGGLSTVNREIATGLAQLGQTVACFVPRPTPDETRLANASGIRVLPSVGPNFMSSMEHLALGPEVPEDMHVDYVIGHDHITGPAASVWAERLGAKYIHVVHTHPDEIASAKVSTGDPQIFKRADDKRNLQLELSRSAVVVVAIAPLLTKHMTTSLRGAVPVCRLDPGLSSDLFSESPSTTYLQEESCLFVGRGDDIQVKGIDLLAGAIKLLRKNAQSTRTQPPTIIFRGYADPEEITTQFGSTQGLRFHPFTSNVQEVWQDLKSASLVLMPSRAEGFGLVAFEAISAGIPVLLSGQSGVATLLRALVKESVITGVLAETVIIDGTGELDHDADVWSQRIQEIMSDRSLAFDQAAKLREQLKHLTWPSAVQGLLNVLPR